MKIYLSGTGLLKKSFIDNKIKLDELNILESFFSIREWQIPLIPKFKNFMLDSGAFTFRHNNKKTINWEEYTLNYAKFIKKYDIKHYFEMDIDNIVGYSKVLKLRSILENETQRKCIPVWHINRGKNDFVDMCEKYDYVAIGGIAGGVLTKRELIKHFPWFIDVAHKNGTKIHGLGFTNVSQLFIYHFDSVDSTTWLNAVRFGELHQFDGNKIVKHGSVIKEKKCRRLLNTQDVVLHNFNEWNKFNKYAELYL